MHVERLGLAVVAVLLLGAAPADVDEAQVRSHVDAYLRDFNAVRTPEYLAKTYLSAPLMIVSGAGARSLNSMEDVEGWLRGTQDDLKQTGWIRSEIREARVCVVAENIAVFSMKLARIGKDGSTVLGGTYVLFKSDRWRITSVVIANPDRLLRCDPSS